MARVFLAYPDHARADHQRSVHDGEYFNSVCEDLKAAGFEVSTRPNARNLKGAQINDAVEHALERTDCFVAFVDRHSTSVGRYLEKALNRKIPILCLKSANNVVSRSAEGDGGVFTLNSYWNRRDAVRIIIDFVKEKTAKPAS